MKLLILPILFASLLSTQCLAQKKDHAEFSLDSGESIQVEDPTAMESIDSTEFDRAFKDPKVKKRKRCKGREKCRSLPSKNLATKKTKIKKVKATKPRVVAKPNGISKSKPIVAVDKKKTTPKKAKSPKSESYFDRVMKVVKVEYSKAKTKAWDFAKKLKKKWDLSK